MWLCATRVCKANFAVKGAKIGTGRPHVRKRGDTMGFLLIDATQQHRLLARRQWAGGVDVSLLAVGDRCGNPAKGVADRRQSLPPATAACAAAPEATAGP
jgi:hypothetical protein